jgi:hypothetical protein
LVLKNKDFKNQKKTGRDCRYLRIGKVFPGERITYKLPPDDTQDPLKRIDIEVTGVQIADWQDGWIDIEVWDEDARGYRKFMVKKDWQVSS